MFNFVSLLSSVLIAAASVKAASVPLTARSCTVTGHIQSIGGGADGWINTADGSDDEEGAVGWTTDQSKAAIFSFDPCSGPVVNIECTNCVGTWTYLGLSINPNSGKDLNPGAPDWGFLALVPEIAVGSGPTWSPSSRVEGYAESAIWQYDSSTSVLTPQWINTDGSSNVIYALDSVYEYLMGPKHEVVDGTDIDTYFKFVKK